MMNPILKGYKVTQIGFVVKNVDEIAEKFRKLTGMEVAATLDTNTIDTSSWKYRGKGFEGCCHNLAFRFDNIELEFIQPSPGNSVWWDFLQEQGEGIHHIAFVVKDIRRVAEEMAQAGYELVQEGEFEGGRFVYFDCTEDLKTTLELLEFDD